MRDTLWFGNRLQGVFLLWNSLVFINRTVSFYEMVKIAEAVGVGYEQAFVLPDGEKIGRK